MEQRSEKDLIENDIIGFLKRNQQKELLRFVTVGSVDDGKSTLIGRLLHDTKGVYDDQLKDATLTSATGEQAIDFARITDGLRAEREQGITIDVAYRYFSTPARKFIIADTPGHVQYTRNMATGASTAHVAIILIDARLGVLSQSRRHAYIASMIEIPHLLVCVNKMDLVDFDQNTYTEICEDFNHFAKDLSFRSLTFVPLSALLGVNIVEPSTTRMPWYKGPTVLQYLETVEIAKIYNPSIFRYPVQYVLRPDLNYRGYCGQITSGSIKKGDTVNIYPSGKSTRIAAIDTFEGEIEEAHAPMSITLRLEDEIDISRGDLIASSPPRIGRHLEIMVVWMSEIPLDPQKAYLIKHGTSYVHANIDKICWKLNMETLEQETDIEHLDLNDIAKIQLTTHRPLAFDPYTQNRATGCFVIIDFMTNNTVAAAMIQDNYEPVVTTERVTSIEREQRLRQKGCLVWARQEHLYQIERTLFQTGYFPVVVEENDMAMCAKLIDLGIIVIRDAKWNKDETANLSTPSNIIEELKTRKII